MRVKNKIRFTIFILITILLSGTIGYFIGSSVYASESEEVIEMIETTPVTEIEVAETVAEAIATIDFEDLGHYTVTAYCGCEKCCGEWSSYPVIGAGGVELVEGIHCAGPLPLGTIVEIEGVGFYEVQDRTANWIVEKYDGKILDIYFDNHEDAIAFGKQILNVKKVIEVM